MVAYEIRSEFLRIRLRPSEKLEIQAAATRSPLPDPSKWARRILLEAARAHRLGDSAPIE